MTKKLETTGHCSQCGHSSQAIIERSLKVRWADEKHPIDGFNEYRILRCKGCDYIFFQEYSVSSEEIDQWYDPKTGEEQSAYIPSIKHWPAPIVRPEPAWLDKLIPIHRPLHAILVEVYKAIDAAVNTLSVIGMRTAFDLLSSFLGVPEYHPFEKKLHELVLLEHISLKEKAILAILTDAGNAAAHRGWHPTDDQRDTLIEALEGFIYRSIFIEGKMKQLGPVIPQRSKKNKSP